MAFPFHSFFVWGERGGQALLIGLSLLIFIVGIIVISYDYWTPGVILLLVGGVGGALSYFWLERPMADPVRTGIREIKNILGSDEIEDEPVVALGSEDRCLCQGADETGTEAESWTAELEEADEEEIERAYRALHEGQKKGQTGAHEDEMLSELRELVELLKSEVDDSKVEALEAAVKSAREKADQSFDEIIKLLDDEHEALAAAIAACTADTQKKIHDLLSHLRELSRSASDKGADVEARLQKLLDVAQ